MALDTRWKNPQGKDPEQLWRWAQDLITELRRGDYLPSTPDAGDIAYDNATSGLTADNVQDAIDENDGRLDDLEAVTPGLVLLNSGIVTNQATLPIVLTSFTAYRGLRFVLFLLPATDDVNLLMRLSSNGGSSYDSGAGNYVWTAYEGRSGAAGDTAQSTGDTSLVLQPGNGAGFGVGNGAAEGVSGEVALLFQANATPWPRVSWDMVAINASSGVRVSKGGGLRTAAQDTDAVEFRFSSGNIATGIWALYGYA